MKLVLKTPDAAVLGSLKPHFFQHAFHLTDDAGHWAAQPVDAGGRVPMLRLAKGRASFEVTTWDAGHPIRFVSERDSVADRCLIPVSGFSVFHDGGRQDFEPHGGGLAMVAGCWRRLNATEAASVQILLPTGGSLESGPIVIPVPHWNDWLDPARDVRQLQRGAAESWREIEVV